MRLIRNAALVLATLLSAFVALVSPASAATSIASHASAVAKVAVAEPAVAYAPFPSCGDDFTFVRNGVDVRVTGHGLNYWSKGYMLVWVAANGESFDSPYPASPYGGANFVIDTGSKTPTTISITLTTDEGPDYPTLCAQDYYA